MVVVLFSFDVFVPTKCTSLIIFGQVVCPNILKCQILFGSRPCKLILPSMLSKCSFRLFFWFLKSYRVDVSNLVTNLNQTSVFECCVVREAPRTNTRKTCVQKRLDHMLKI